MALRDLPYLPLNVQDFLNDEKLLECSASATGVYIRLMCMMHKSDPYGKIAIKSRDISLFDEIEPLGQFASQLVRHMPYDEQEILNSLKELVGEGVLYVDGNYLCQKRMIRDSEISEKRAEAGRRGSSITNKRFAATSDATSVATSDATNDATNDAAKPSAKSSAKSSAKPKTEPKQNYAETVKMTETEYGKLVSEYGEDGAKRLVELLDNYKAASGHTYKSDYRAILNWVVERYKEELRKKGQSVQSSNNVNEIWK